MLKKLIETGQPILGSWCQIGNPANAEILAKSGFAWMALDCEHGENITKNILDICEKSQ